MAGCLGSSRASPQSTGMGAGALCPAHPTQPHGPCARWRECAVSGERAMVRRAGKRIEYEYEYEYEYEVRKALDGWGRAPPSAAKPVEAGRGPNAHISGSACPGCGRFTSIPFSDRPSPPGRAVGKTDRAARERRGERGAGERHARPSRSAWRAVQPQRLQRRGVALGPSSARALNQPGLPAVGRRFKTPARACRTQTGLPGEGTAATPSDPPGTAASTKRFWRPSE